MVQTIVSPLQGWGDGDNPNVGLHPTLLFIAPSGLVQLMYVLLFLKS